jgi:hypothetical protein
VISHVPSLAPRLYRNGFAASLVSDAYLLLLLGRTSDPVTLRPNNLWGRAVSPLESVQLFMPHDKKEAAQRKREERTSSSRFSITVSAYAVEALCAISQPPLGQEVADAVSGLRAYRDPDSGA